MRVAQGGFGAEEAIREAHRAAFIQSMNNKARALHMANTHFDDPTGLSPDNLSMARDVVKMAAAASHCLVIGSFTTLPRYEEVVGSRTRFYHNTDPVVLQSDRDVQRAETSTRARLDGASGSTSTCQMAS
ncbi:hypothetical protein PTKU46_94110 [Paraburkholderia terrae]|uniref:hypothetical protein n=1 Tax=Paraburkholderia terrae TaxID=311230 RepID=UPI0030E59625